MKDHAVVCGLGRRGLAVIESLHDKGMPVVAVEKAPEPDVVEHLHKLGVPLVIGDALRPEVLREARLERAVSLYALCAEDATNCEISACAAKIAPRSGGKRRCFVHISDTELRSALQGALESQADGRQQRLSFVDAFDPEALDLLVHGLPLDHDGIRPDEVRRAHLVILGFGRMGRTLAVRAAQLGQFANGSRVRISVVDRKADQHRAALLFHHPQIEQAVDIAFYNLEAVSPETRNLVEDWCQDLQTMPSLVVGFDHETLALEIVLQLLPVFERTGVRVALRMPGRGGLAHILDKVKAAKSLRIHTFGLDERFAYLATPEDEPIEKFARDIHSAYVAERCRQAACQPGGVEQAKINQELLAWDALSEDFRESNRQQAAHLYFKLRALGYEAVPKDDPRPAIAGFSTEQLERLSIMEHDRWVAERRVAGWVYGEPSDKPRRINANLIPYEQLTESMKDYDRAAVRLIPALLDSVGLKICQKISA